jgi:hypothetical protein
VLVAGGLLWQETQKDREGEAGDDEEPVEVVVDDD